MNKEKLLKTLSKVYLIVGIIFIFFAFSVLTITFYPQIWYSIDKEATETEAYSINEEVMVLQEKEKEEITKEIKVESTLPDIDESLPKENTIKVSSIGIDSVVVENSDAFLGLEDGIWRVPDFGTPDSNELPIILAAHRFGYVYWTKEFRDTSSFYNLPKLRVGDRVQLIWGQRSYEYEVYKAEDNTQITDYDADLILYTCRMYNSPVRVFRYLSRVN
jgi:sortase (surface protein transpeptidase)